MSYYNRSEPIFNFEDNHREQHSQDIISNNRQENVYDMNNYLFYEFNNSMDETAPYGVKNGMDETAPYGVKNGMEQTTFPYGVEDDTFESVIHGAKDEMYQTFSDDLFSAASSPKEWSRDNSSLREFWKTNVEIKDGDSTNTNKISTAKKRTKAAKGVKKIKSDEEKQKASDAVRKSTLKKKAETEEEIEYLIELKATVSELKKEVRWKEKELNQMKTNLYY